MRHQTPSLSNGADLNGLIFMEYIPNEDELYCPYYAGFGRKFQKKFPDALYWHFLWEWNLQWDENKTMLIRPKTCISKETFLNTKLLVQGKKHAGTWIPLCFLVIILAYNENRGTQKLPNLFPEDLVISSLLCKRSCNALCYVVVFSRRIRFDFQFAEASSVLSEVRGTKIGSVLQGNWRHSPDPDRLWGWATSSQDIF